MRYEIGIIGGGKMGTAIARGLKTQNVADSVWIGVRQGRTKHLNDLGVLTFEEYSEPLMSSRIVILAVRPDQIIPLVQSLADAKLLTPDHVLVSVAAGVSAGDVESCLKPLECAIVRVMPNTLIREGHGLSVISPGKHARPDQVQSVSAIFETLGAVVQIDSDLMDAATAMAASMPAFVYAMIDAMVMSGIGMGLSAQDATTMTTSVLAGTASVINETGEHPMVLLRSITTPGGCTIAGLHQLEAAGMRKAINQALTTTAIAAGKLS